ncbi:MAG: type I pullulanase [Bacteroidota bacterium]|nr:type I pullulanase [Bacteroidota bacterium]
MIRMTPDHMIFDHLEVCNDDDLGVFSSGNYTFVKIWAPTASAVELRIYNQPVGGKSVRSIFLFPSDCGTWSKGIEENLLGLFYTIRVRINGTWQKEHPDIYAKAVGLNGHRGAFIDLEKLKPVGWDEDKGPEVSPVDAVIYETHVRDFSISPDSGAFHKGKYLAFTEERTETPGGLTSGLDHLVELGITHIHFLPVFDFFTVDERRPDRRYNWGYDPQNYNVPEGSFSTNPNDGRTRIYEFREMVAALHRKGIGVIMDVVFNHTYFNITSGFNQTVPGYFYRFWPDGTWSNGSGCGNELATERFMVRKFIIDSLLHWMTNYHIDGFRFDLMGCIDLETMRQIEKATRKIKPSVLLYGEGWTAGQSPLPVDSRTLKANVRQLHGVAAFSDDFRDAIGGSWNSVTTKGFASGLTLREEAVKFGIVAAGYHPQIEYGYVGHGVIPWSAHPTQCVNYVACHDNYTLYDRLKLASPEDSDQTLLRRCKLTAAILLFSQGIPFIQAGMEFMRTKKMHYDSYCSPDSINQLEWSLKDKYKSLSDYFSILIRIRKTHPAFRMPYSDMVHKFLCFPGTYVPGVVSFELGAHANNDPWEWIFVLFNANNYAVDFYLPHRKWKFVINGSEVDENMTSLSEDAKVTLPPISGSVLAVF